MTLTWVSETSGNASIGSVLKATTPPAMNKPASSKRKSGWCRAKEMVRLIMEQVSRFGLGNPGRRPQTAAEMRLHDLVPTIQVAIGPVILISGVGLLLLSMTNRLGRVIDRARQLCDVERR